tara:strand:+ start:1354 stop:2559 length:1206 start_codon:yes stop_codon:yes gene_type:complete
LLISISSKTINFKKDKWNLTLFICSIILVINTLNISIIENDNPVYKVLKDYSWDLSSTWLNLFNWIPFFLIFSGLQIYLKTNLQRARFIKCLFIGVIPIILSLLLQKWFHIYGPFSYLNGLIVFYLKPIDNLGGFTGIFNNPNYAGIWLASSLPFSFALMRIYKYKKIKMGLIFLIIVLTFYCILSTNSRNSFAGIIISSIFMVGFKFLIISFLFLGTLYFLLLELNLLSLFGSLGIQEFIPITIFNKLLQTNYLSKLQFLRIDIWGKAISFILEKPILGWGAATFPVLYLLKGGLEGAQHTHSMPLEIAQTNGIPLAIILVIFVIRLFSLTFKIVFIKNKNEESIIDKALITSFLIIMTSHITDVTYYEGRVSLLIWILMAGLKCILDEDKIKNNNLKIT